MTVFVGYQFILLTALRTLHTRHCDGWRHLMYVCIFAVAIFTIPVELGSEYPEFFKTQNFVSLNFVSIS